MFHQNPISSHHFDSTAYNNAVFTAMSDCLTENEDYRIDESKIPLPTELLKHELQVDTQLQDTLLSLCDSKGVPFKIKYLGNDYDSVMDFLATDEFLEKMPMNNEINHFIARDYLGIPVSKREVERSSQQRLLYEKRAMKIINKYKEDELAKKESKKKKTEISF